MSPTIKHIAYLEPSTTIHTQGVHTEEPPPLEFRNKAYLHNIALVHVSLISTVMQRVLGHTVTPRAGTELDTPHRQSNSTVTPQS